MYTHLHHRYRHCTCWRLLSERQRLLQSAKLIHKFVLSQQRFSVIAAKEEGMPEGSLMLTSSQ